jgi:hypothetical protein
VFAIANFYHEAMEEGLAEEENNVADVLCAASFVNVFLIWGLGCRD